MSLRNKVINGTIKLTMINYLLFIFNFLIQLYLAKALSPNTFGQMSFLLAIISVFSAFGQWGVASVIAIRNDKKFLDTIFTMKLLFSILLFSASILYLKNIPSNRSLKTIFIFISFAMSIQNIAEMPRLVLQINLEFSKIGLIRVINKVAAILITLIFVLLKLELWALGLLYGIEMLLEVFFIIVSPYKMRLNFDIKNSIWFFKYAKNILVVNFMGTLENKYDDFIVGKISGNESLGFYNVGWKISRLFNTTTISTFSSVVVPSLAKVRANKIKFNDSYNFLMRNTVRLLCLVYGIVFIIASFMIDIFMGAEWKAAAKIIRYGIIYSMLLPLYTINREVFYSLGRPDIHKKVQIILFGVIVVSVPLGVMLFDEVGAVLALSLAYIIGTTLSFVLLGKQVEIKYLSIFTPSLVGVLGAGVVSWNVNKSVLIQIISFVVIYLFILAITNYHVLKSDLSSVFKSLK